MNSLEMAALKFDASEIKAQAKLNGNELNLTLRQTMNLIEDKEDAAATLEGVLRNSDNENIADHFQEYLNQAIVKNWLF